MSTELIHAFAAGTGGTENGITTIVIPTDGYLSKVHWAVSAVLNANGEYAYVELGFTATNQAALTDTRGVISQVRTEFGLLTSGAAATGINHEHSFEDLPVNSGERMYLHILAAAGVVTNINILVHLEGTASRRRSARRSQ